MSIEIDSRIWFTEGKESDARERFLDLVKIVSESEYCSGKWQRFSIRDAMTDEKLANISQNVDIDDLEEVTRSFQDSPVSFRIYVPIRAWRFSGMQATDAFVMLGLTVWSNGFLKARNLDPEVNSHAQVSVLDAGPFFELVDDEILAHENAADINEKVSENTENLIQLLLGISSGLPVEKMYVFTDLGDYLPGNAHIAYFQNAKVLASEANKYIHVLRVGAGKIKPCHEISIEENWYLHELRSKERKEHLLRELTDIAKVNNPVNLDGVHAVLESGEFDYFENDGRLLVLDYPFFANAFLDRFFISLIKGKH